MTKRLRTSKPLLKSDPSAPKAPTLLGGEDVGALIFDLGSDSFRVGYAQEDTPRFMLPGVFGRHANGYEFDSSRIHFPRPDMDVAAVSTGGGFIQDWDAYERYFDYACEKMLHADPTEHPILATEPSLHKRAQREKLTEIMFEKHAVRSFYLLKNAASVAFRFHRENAIIVDCGASHTTVSAVHDGIVLQRTVQTSPIGGNFLREKCRELLNDNKIEVVPSYLVESKQRTETLPAIWKRKPNVPNVKPSWSSYVKDQVMKDLKEHILEAYPESYTGQPCEEFIPYEFPNGYTRVTANYIKFGPERYEIAETMFRGGGADLSEMVLKCLKSVHVDHRSQLYSNIIITGGNSLIPGFATRLDSDVRDKLTSVYKVKVLVAQSAAEQKFASWTGGSIVATNGTFQSMWFSLEQYREHGPQYINSKCM